MGESKTHIKLSYKLVPKVWFSFSIFCETEHLSQASSLSIPFIWQIIPPLSIYL